LFPASLYELGIKSSEKKETRDRTLGISKIWPFRRALRKSQDFFGVQDRMATMKRYLEKYIRKDLKRKIILLTGPRQTGKTTLSKMLDTSFDYFKYDNAEHRLSLMEKSWDRSRPLVIFDELHKMKNWKSWLKGIYDTEKIPPSLVVTGSAKLDAHKKVGDSLAGRFFSFGFIPWISRKSNKRWDPTSLRKNSTGFWRSEDFPNPTLKVMNPITIAGKRATWT
jgi:uncharacterized protein